MKKIIKIDNLNNGVSEVVGTILLLGICVAIFSVLYMIVLSEPFETSESHPTVVAFVEGNNIVIEHRGGDELSADGEFEYTIGGTKYKTQIGSVLDDTNSDGKWNLGERLYIPIEYNLSNSTADLFGTDADNSETILLGTLDIFPETDLGIDITIDNENPKIGDSINITITVTNYRGDINATSIKIKYLIPDGLEYWRHFPSDANYDNATGIWVIDKEIPIRGSVSLKIEVNVTGTDVYTEPTQLAMVLDGSGSISDHDWDLMRKGLANAIENESVFPHDGSVELTIVQFGGDQWNLNWNDYNSEWYRDRYYSHSGKSSVRSDYNDDGYFICNGLNTADASSITIDFWYRLDDTENDDLQLFYYNGVSYNYVTSLGGGTKNTWLHFTDTITDPQYFIPNFKLRFYSDLEGRWWNSENVWIDDVLIETDRGILLKDSFEKVAFARVEIPPVVITDVPGDPGYYLDIANQIRTIPQLDGWTPIGCGLRLAADQLYDMGFYTSDDRQVINLVTDGMPNCKWIPGTYTAESNVGYDLGKISAEEARDYILNTLQMDEKQDEIDSLAVGVGGMYGSPDTDWLNDSIVWPQPGYIGPPFDKGSGWVSTITTWEDFERAITEMFRIQFASIKTTVELVSLDPRDPNPNNNIFTATIVPQEN